MSPSTSITFVHLLDMIIGTCADWGRQSVESVLVETGSVIKRPRSFSSIVAVVMVMACLLAPVALSASFAADSPPQPAPDRRLRNRSEAPVNAYGGAGKSTTTVSLTGAVSRLDGSADADGDPRRAIQGKIESLVETPLMERQPRAEQVPPLVFRGWLEKAHPQFALSASSLPDSSVVCVKGRWDNSAKTLSKFQIPHVKITSRKVASYPLHEQGTRVVIVDCAGDLSREARQKLRDFVSAGGYLLSTDWALDRFTAPTFNNYIVWNKGYNRSEIVDATANDTDPVLFNHAVTNASWKLDESSHLIRIMNRDAVRVLARSTKLAAEDPEREGILAVVFPFGRGYVMHMTAHFDNNGDFPLRGDGLPDPAPVIRISLRQALAANFVVAGLTRTPIATKYKR